MKKQKYYLIFFISFILLYILITPFISIISLKLHFDRKKIGSLNTLIDYNSLQKSLSFQVDKKLSIILNKNLNNNYYQLNKIISKSLSSFMVRSLLKPKTINKLLYLNKSYNQDYSKNRKGNTTNIISNIKVFNSEISNYSFKYKNVNQFLFRVNFDTDSNYLISLWQRHSLIHWKLTDLDISNIDLDVLMPD